MPWSKRIAIAVVGVVFVWSARIARADQDPGSAAPAAAAAAAPAAAADPSANADADADSDEVAAEAAADAEVSPEAEQEFDADFANVPHEVGEEIAAGSAGGGAAAPAITAEQLHELIRAARAKVLPRMEAKIEVAAAKKMSKLGKLIFLFSLSGVLLLAMPLALRKRYPDQMRTLVKYSALAAVAFFVTVNLFGVIALGFRGAQAVMAKATNPQLKIAEGFFDGLDENADEMVPFAGQLIGPTLYQLQNTDEQPTVLLLENGQKLIKDANVFVSVAHMFKKVDFIFSLLPISLLLVTLVLFVVSIKPTLMEIVQLPGAVARGEASGSAVVKGAVRRVLGEVLVALCTVGVLFVLTLIAGTILGFVVKPALYSIIEFFGTAIVYLQIEPGASSGLIFASLLGVILFLVLNLAAIILAMSFFLGKTQKIFQRRFHDGQALTAHTRFWKWGIPAVLVAQIVPLLYMIIASWALEKIETKLIGDGSSIPWTAVMLVGPLFLVIGFAVAMWAGRGIKAIAFLAKYKVPPVPPLRLPPA